MGQRDEERFYSKLASGESVYGISDPLDGIDSAAVIANHSAVDWIWIDAEHGAYWIETVRQKLAVCPEDTIGLVRIPGSDPKEVEQVLDAGADGVIIPKLRTAEQVREFVESAYYPPKGDRGVAGTVPTTADHDLDISQYYESINEDVFVVVQVETAELVDQIDEVARIEGISSLFLGPADLSHGLGDPFDYETPAFQRAANSILESAEQNDLVPGYWVGSEDVSEFTGSDWQMLALGQSSELLAAEIERRFPR